MTTKLANYRSLQDDISFKYVFSNYEILNDLINSFFKFMGSQERIVLTKIEVQKYMLPNKQTVKTFLGDIVCVLDNGYIVNLEMFKNNFRKRDYKKSLSYICKTYLEQMKNGEKTYENIKKVIGISFMKGNYRRQNGKIVNSYRLEEKETGKVIDDGELELHLVRMDLVPKITIEKEEENRYNEIREQRFIKWLQLMNAQSLDELKKIGKDDKVMEEVIKMVNEWTEETGKNGLETYIDNVKFEAEERGEIRGEIKGRREGKKEGIMEGRKVGRKDGAKEKSIAIAKNMLNNDEPINKIENYTGLTKKQIMALM